MLVCRLSVIYWVLDDKVMVISRGEMWEDSSRRHASDITLTLCPLIGVFNLFKFKLIIDMYNSYSHFIIYIYVLFSHFFFKNSF